MRTPSDKTLVHERLGDRFGAALSEYDSARRVAVLVDRFLPPERVKGKTALDVGCGLGHFSQRLVESGARVTACDIGPQLVGRTMERCPCEGVVADALSLTERFGPERFDVVVSSECIEHTPEPARALREMAGVLKPGGYLAVSTPNLAWLPVVKAATALRLRPFDGFENFSTFSSIRRTLEHASVKVLEEVGLHLWPFQLPLHGLSRWVDDHCQFARGLMINLCVSGQKQLA